jgi:chromosomal replication initiation ATPase DnaA
MTIPSEHITPPAQPEDADTTLLPPEARAAVAEIKAENAALEMDDQIAEAQAKAMEEHARQLVEVTEEVLEELQERKGSASPG